MLNKFKFVVALIAGTLTFTACSSGVEVEDITDTSQSMNHQVAASGVTPFHIDNEDWDYVGFSLCNWEKIGDFKGAETIDEAMVNVHFDTHWDQEERAILADIIFANYCPQRMK